MCAEFDPADVANAQEGGIRECTDDYFAELIGRGEAAGSNDGVLQLRSVGGGSLADGAGWILAVLGLDGVADIGGGDAELGHFVGVEPDAHGVRLGNAEAGFPDAGQAAELVHQIDLRVIGEEERIVSLVVGDETNGDEEGGGDFFDGDTLALDLRRQAGQSDIDAVLGLDGSDVGIGAEFEGNVDDERAVVGHRRLVIEHPVKPDELLFDGLGDGLFQVECVAAEIAGGDLHGRRNYFGVGGNGQRRYRYGAENDNKDRDHHREDGSVDKKFCHGVSPWRVCRERGLRPCRDGR